MRAVTPRSAGAAGLWTGATGVLWALPTAATGTLDYLRARWIPEGDGPGWADIDLLIQQITQLKQEQEILPPPGDHVH